jgi:hypothetical protein
VHLCVINMRAFMSLNIYVRDIYIYTVDVGKKLLSFSSSFNIWRLQRHRTHIRSYEKICPPTLNLYEKYLLCMRNKRKWTLLMFADYLHTVLKTDDFKMIYDDNNRTISVGNVTFSRTRIIYSLFHNGFVMAVDWKNSSWNYTHVCIATMFVYYTWADTGGE